eukprot:Protomagalhaensia_wolfi_Nauph_80__2365@NODE_2554_length_1055_cov_240_501969_g1998_i0_p1_GENE_NODE_2554_length_1055_cov_240_501969_g1998_i0NODE_2554_length_1055_cov_240_501969_g1998_i0_p1_ORF_typecomplete_len326_score14_28YTH/PF04146_15/2_7e35YTH/PF04146_15/1_4e04_NODE_2554_length_1055_cov_240_501969_g1998_i0301007
MGFVSFFFSMLKVDDIDNLWSRLKSNPKTQYYLLKSFAAEHITLSKETGVWATGVKKERVLANAFSTGNPVVLVFSVNGSGKFFGYALMASRPGECSIRRPVFTGPDGQPFPGNQFHVQWLNTRELSFKYFEHITNDLNEGKPVKVGRDGQPISWEAGGKLLEAFEQTDARLMEPQGNQLRGPDPSSMRIEALRTPPGRAVVFIDRQEPASGAEDGTKPPPPPPPSGMDKKLLNEDVHVSFQDCLHCNPALAIYPIDLTKRTVGIWNFIIKQAKRTSVDSSQPLSWEALRIGLTQLCNIRAYQMLSSLNSFRAFLQSVNRNRNIR